MKMSHYELQRLRNMEKNAAILAPMVDPNDIFLTKRSTTRNKRKQQTKTTNAGKIDVAEMPPQKKARPSQEKESDPSNSGLRRSSRLENRTQAIDYRSDHFEHLARLPSIVYSKSQGIDSESTIDNVGNRLGKRTQNPKVFGHIPGVEVGTWWETRAQCSTDAVHAPFVAGISGDSRLGAYSVALSGGYDDDVDMGTAFTFTGSGGRDLKGTAKNPKNLRTAPQSSDQSFENPFNKSLQISAQTKRPVRVIRGYKLQSKFAPAEGYRYDGLYTVEKVEFSHGTATAVTDWVFYLQAWMEPGLNPGSFKVCKFAFKRCRGQPAIEEREEDRGGDGVEEGREDK